MIKIGLTSFISFNILYRNRNKSSQEQSWFTTNVSIHTGGWHGQFNADFRAEELLGLKKDLQELNKNPTHSFKFDPQEPWLKLELAGTETQRLKIKGEACDNFESGNKLFFNLTVDQSSLPKLLEDFKEVVKKFSLE